MIFYVYFWLREDGTPYYVGKGCGKRAYIHRGHHIKPPKDEERILIQEYNSEEDAFSAEKFFISLFGRKDANTGILQNRTDGGEGPKGKIISFSTRQKLREYFKGRPKPPRTEEHCRNIAIAKLGSKNPQYKKSRSEEIRKKLSVQFSGSGNPFFGRKHSEDTLALFSRMRAGKKIPRRKS